MSIIINIKPEAQAELMRQAAAHGLDSYEAEIRNLSDAQAIAIGRFAVAFNMLESVIDDAIPSLIDASVAGKINVLLEHDIFLRVLSAPFIPRQLRSP